MKKSLKIIVFVLVGLLLVAGSGGGVWWWMQRKAPTGDAAVAKPAFDKQEYKYLSLDKVIVMLHGGMDAQSHYLAVDLVFKMVLEKERKVKEDLPLLRSIAVMALSKYPLEKASAMTVEQLAADINAAYVASYKHDNYEMPFVEAMISKLIIE
jgi:flagellar protein FliL